MQEAWKCVFPRRRWNRGGLGKIFDRLNNEFPGTHLNVAPLKENLDHLHGAVKVWV